MGSCKARRGHFSVDLGGVMLVMSVAGILLIACSSEQEKPPERPVERAAEEHPDFKQLKKRMKADFKQIRKAVRKRRPLDTELIRRFCSDARLMTTYPGKGDEYYPGFLKRADSFEAAAKRGSWDLLEDAVVALQKTEKQCHKRFKW